MDSLLVAERESRTAMTQRHEPHKNRKHLLDTLLAAKVTYRAVKRYRLSTDELRYLYEHDSVSRKEYVRFMQGLGLSRATAYRRFAALQKLRKVEEVTSIPVSSVFDIKRYSYFLLKVRGETGDSISVREAAERLRVSQGYIRGLVADGKVITFIRGEMPVYEFESLARRRKALLRKRFEKVKLKITEGIGELKEIVLAYHDLDDGPSQAFLEIVDEAKGLMEMSREVELLLNDLYNTPVN